MALSAGHAVLPDHPLAPVVGDDDVAGARQLAGERGVVASEAQQRVDPSPIEADHERVADGEGGRGVDAARLEEGGGLGIH
jgi:hypothetical protein